LGLQFSAHAHALRTVKIFTEIPEIFHGNPEIFHGYFMDNRKNFQ